MLNLAYMDIMTFGHAKAEGWDATEDGTLILTEAQLLAANPEIIDGVRVITVPTVAGEARLIEGTDYIVKQAPTRAGAKSIPGNQKRRITP